MMYLTITIAIHIHSLVIQSCLCDEPRDSLPKGYDQSPSLTGWTQEFDYYSVAYELNVQDIVDILHVSLIQISWIYPLQNIIIIFEIQNLTEGQTMNISDILC